MEASGKAVARAHALGSAGLAMDVLLVVLGGVLLGAKIIGNLSLAYWPTFPALTGVALLIGIPAGAFLGWSNEQRRAIRLSAQA